jgi:hypothetical protein
MLSPKPRNCVSTLGEKWNLLDPCTCAEHPGDGACAPSERAQCPKQSVRFRAGVGRRSVTHAEKRRYVKRTTPVSIGLALVPVLALTLGIPFANRLEPRIAGLPFLLAYIVIWIVLTPLFLLAVYRSEGRT